jgi:hypothetical protein
MGTRYRKSFKAGPFRVTASKSGISYSAGVKGARVTKRADGRVQTTLSVPHTGLSYSSTKTPVSCQATTKQTAASLPGRRSTVLPQPPPAAIRVPPVKGYLATVTLLPDWIQIDRTFLGRINGNHSSRIRWQELAGVDFLDPTRAINGHVHFATASDPRGLTATGGGNRMAAAARNPHAIMFTWQQRAIYQRLRDMLTASAVPRPVPPHPAGTRNSHTSAPHRPIADELAKLHQLYQQGALTPAEFEQAKAQLLQR